MRQPGFLVGISNIRFSSGPLIGMLSNFAGLDSQLSFYARPLSFPVPLFPVPSRTLSRHSSLVPDPSSLLFTIIFILSSRKSIYIGAVKNMLSQTASVAALGAVVTGAPASWDSLVFTQQTVRKQIAKKYTLPSSTLHPRPVQSAPRAFGSVVPACAGAAAGGKRGAK